MVRSAYILLKEEDLAKEAAQEAFVAVWNNRATLDPAKSIRAYLKTATTSRAINLLKSTNHHRGSGEEALSYISAAHLSPAQEAENQELGQHIQVAVDSLPPRCREVFVLAKYHGLSHKAIAAQLGISPKTVEHQVAKAIKSLREKLKTYRSIVIIFALAVGEFIIRMVS